MPAVRWPPLATPQIRRGAPAAIEIVENMERTAEYHRSRLLLQEWHSATGLLYVNEVIREDDRPAAKRGGAMSISIRMGAAGRSSEGHVAIACMAVQSILTDRQHIDAMKDMDVCAELGHQVTRSENDHLMVSVSDPAWGCRRCSVSDSSMLRYDESS